MSPVAVGLEFSQTGSSLQGTFTLQESSFPFVGEVEPNRITGTVRSADGSLTAALVREGGRLAGTFMAAEESGCTAGGTSVAVYEVTLVRR